ncbi:MAG: type II secretion system protein [Chloroflexi bacterium]|nr:type II secretion system protein [Chloroflexota bacterium]
MRVFRVGQVLRGLAHRACTPKCVTARRRESGMTLIETVIALAVLGMIAVAFLTGLATLAKLTVTNDVRTTAESLALSQLEWAKKASYVYEAAGYSPAPLPGGQDYSGYSALVTAAPLRSPDDGIQRITVTIKRLDKGIVSLEGYKVDR